MTSRYIANTPAEQREMLRTVGAASIEDLLVKIPPKARLSRPLALPPALAESDLVRHMRALAERNADADRFVCFMGAGSYDHFVPSPIDHLISRGEFFTAYTPYQPEASQGTLRSIYEYQTMIAELTGMDVANASIYDGASSLAEAALMGVIGGALGLVIGVFLEWYVLRVMILDEAGFLFPMLVPWVPAAVVFGLSVVLATLVGLWPAYHATRLRITEAIAYE